MLVLRRSKGESICIGVDKGEPEIVISVVEITQRSVRIGIEAHRDINVHRAEVWQRVCSKLPEAERRVKNEQT